MKKDRMKVLKLLTVVVAVLYIMGACIQLLIFTGVEGLIKIDSISMAVSYSLIFPIYLLYLERYYLENNIILRGLKKSIKYMAIVLIMEFIFAIIGTVIISKVAELNQNINIIAFEHSGNMEIVIILIALLWSLMGEEGGKLAFFLLSDKYLKIFPENENKRYYFIWFIDCLVFGLCHLSAYGNNIFQVIFVIGIPSIVYGYLWKKTKNPFIMWITHAIYDYLIFAVILLS